MHRTTHARMNKATWEATAIEPLGPSATRENIWLIDDYWFEYETLSEIIERDIATASERCGQIYGMDTLATTLSAPNFAC